VSHASTQQPAATRRKIAGERAARTPAPRAAATATAGRLGVDGADGGARAARTVPGWLLFGLALLAAAVLAADGVAWARSATATATADRVVDAAALNAAPAAAEKAAEQILSYDYARLRQDTAAAAGLMTPAYAQTFERTVDDLLADAATAQRGVVSAKVTASGVVAADQAAGTIDVLLFVDQTSTTKASRSPRTALNRVVFTMAGDDGRWLVDDITAL
jgi:Mce-associated membrane protein